MSGRCGVSLPPSIRRLAQLARVQGLVELKCRIVAPGEVTECAASGHPLLKEAALENVKKWRFRWTGGDGEESGGVSLKFEFVLLLDSPVQTPLKVEFSFDYPNHARIVSEVPYPNHIPCIAQEWREWREMKSKTGTRSRGGIP